MAENILIFPYLIIIMYEIVEGTTLLHAMKMANALVELHTHKSNEHLWIRNILIINYMY